MPITLRPLTDIPRWLEHMPVIPLTSSVPVLRVRGDDAIPWCRTVTVGEPERGDWIRVQSGHTTAPLQRFESLRVDLDHPQGFGYAIRWATSALKGIRVGTPLADRAIPLRGKLVSLRQRWFWSEEEPLDCDDLALILSQVVEILADRES